MRALVTGASGFLGSNIADAWTEDHLLGACMTGRARGYDACLEVDITTSRSVEQMASVQPDVIVHAAALASLPLCELDPHAAYQVNVVGTHHVARAARKTGARLVYISTDAVFGGTRGGYIETSSPSPGTVYGKTKWLGERAALQAVPDALIVRVNFFGWSPSGTSSIIEFFVNALAAGERVNGYTDYTVTTGYAPDVAASMRRLIDLGATGTYHLTSADALSKYDFGVAVAEEFGLDAGLITPTPAPRRANLALNCDKGASLLGPLPTQAEGIGRACRG